MIKEVNTILTTIKTQKPLVLNITNDVTMDFIANGLLSIGASPVMSQSELELEELIAYAGAVIINIGTLDARFIQLCHQACRIANQQNKPIIFDPVGAGATQYRTKTALDLINTYQMAIVRGNAGEILALCGEMGATKGVDSVADSQHVVMQAKALSKKLSAAIVMSGKVDVIAMNDEVALLEGGSEMMPMITGTGCLLTAVVGAFHAVEKNIFAAAKASAYFYAKCGELAAQQAQGPGTFRLKFLDQLNLLLV